MTRLFAVPAAALVALSIVTAPVDAARAADPTGGSVVIDGVRFGSGSFTSQTYTGIWEGARTDTIWIPTDNEITATAYFTNYPNYDPIMQRPSSGDITTRYQWTAKCSPNGAQMALTSWKTISVPVWSNWQPSMGPPGPSYAVTDRIAVPSHCWLLSARVYVNPARNNNIGSDGPFMKFFSPGEQHVLRAERDAQGRAQLYAVGSRGDIQQVSTSGIFPESTHQRLRYYFLTCTAARTFLDTMIGAGQAAAGIVKVPVLDDALPLAAGAIARQAGKPDLTVFTWEQGATLAYGEAKVVVQQGTGGALGGC